MRNETDRAVGVKYSHFGAVRFLVRKGKELVYDSEANKYYIRIAFFPSVRVLRPGQEWALEGEWNYRRNAWGSSDRSRVPGGVYQLSFALSAIAAPEGKMESKPTAFRVPGDDASQDLRVKLTKSLDAEAGEVALTMTVTNTGKQTATLAFDSFPTWRFEIRDARSSAIVITRMAPPASIFSQSSDGR